MKETPARAIARVEGRVIPLRGDDIDTDRIIPARYLRCVTFDGLGEHAFEDDRKAVSAKGECHPFDAPRYRGAGILVVNRNFGCGSSREHAPQSLARWGIHAIIGESFAEIFAGNCTALGIPLATAERNEVEALLRFAEVHPDRKACLDLVTATVTFGDRKAPVRIAPGPRDSLIRGTWDVTGLLLEKYGEVEAASARLPYVRGF